MRALLLISPQDIFPQFSTFTRTAGKSDAQRLFDKTKLHAKLMWRSKPTEASAPSPE
jgi:hypothetical protein